MSAKVVRRLKPSTTLLGCAYCPVCCVYSSHFAKDCPRKAKIPAFDAMAVPSLPPKKKSLRVFALPDDYETYVEYCKGYNLTYPQNNKAGCHRIVKEHLESRGFELKNPHEEAEWLQEECHQPCEMIKPKASSVKKLKSKKNEEKP